MHPNYLTNTASQINFAVFTVLRLQASISRQHCISVRPYVYGPQTQCERINNYRILAALSGRNLFAMNSLARVVK